MQLGRLAMTYRAAVVAHLSSDPFFLPFDKLRPPSMGTLRIIGAHGPISQREVAAALRAHASDMVAVIDLLEDYGLVSRVRSQADRRRYDLTLTDRGREVRDAFVAATKEVDAVFFAVLTEREQATLQRLLDRLVTAHESDYGASIPKASSASTGGPNR